jgi:hypothetical protein
MIADSGLIARLRLSSLDPREVPDRLLDLLAASKTICPHLHICAQAGDDEILRQMRRNYDTAYYRELLAKVRERRRKRRWQRHHCQFPANRGGFRSVGIFQRATADLFMSFLTPNGAAR